jgi:internalin A
MESLKGLTGLREISLLCTGITNDGLQRLRCLPELQSLLIGTTEVDDMWLEQLSMLTQLKYLKLISTNVTDEGAKKLQRALPDCEIERWSYGEE